MRDWSTPFDPSLLSDDLIIHIPTAELAEQLAQLLDGMGVTWSGGQRLIENTRWEIYLESAVWHFHSREGPHGFIYHGDKSNVDLGLYSQDIACCTFVGAEPLDDFDIPDNASLF